MVRAAAAMFPPDIGVRDIGHVITPQGDRLTWQWINHQSWLWSPFSELPAELGALQRAEENNSDTL